MRHSMVHNALYNTVYRFLNIVFPLVTASYAARILTPYGVGRVTFAQNTISYFVMFAVLGIPSYGTREIARVKDSSEETDKLFSELLLLNAVSTSVCLLIYCFAIWNYFNSDATLYMVIGLELAFNYFNIDWLYQGKEEYGYIAKRSIIIKALSLVAMYLLVKDRGDCIIYALIYSFGIGCNYCFNVIHAKKYVRFTIHGLNFRRHFRPIIWLMFNSTAASLYNKVDITMLGTMSSASCVAYYSNAHKIVAAALGLVTSISAVFLPRLSYMYVTDKERYEYYLSVGTKIILILAVPACIGLYLTADSIILVMFGEMFHPGAVALKILAVLLIIKGIGDLLCYQAIISAGEEQVLIFSRIAAGVTNVILNAVLIPRWEHNGAAIASVISEFIVNGFLLRYTLSRIHLNFKKSFLISIAVAVAVMTVVVRLVQIQIESGMVALVVSVLTGVMVYCVVLLATKNELLLKIIKSRTKM